ncbi:hypothetical protein GCM10011505_06020 [Tistrella bauzanensis]|uniref:Uncharacterized protein n=1 Tax=Tistrella bauzanensis TaxID=657419 RepID=A0ABQ1IAN2_9PROT|nr:hypothetical protein [Tistrella bauzanensis]GGB27533.1 hypothetical protein GCM10011505_06020 [Tistrella bauzanensis]
MASAHPDSRKSRIDTTHPDNGDAAAIDTELQDLYAAYGTESDTPPEMLDLARQAAAAFSAQGTGADERPLAADTARDGTGGTQAPAARMPADDDKAEDGSGAMDPT